MSNITLVLGGASSGKSLFAERLAEESDNVTYMATARPIDDEMLIKIEKHRQRRPGSWNTVELDGSNLIEALAGVKDECLVIDAMTLYVADAMTETEDPSGHMIEVIKALQRVAGRVIVVSDEVGLGLVPDTPSGRAFRELLGLVNQRFARVADNVYFVAAGLSMTLKRNGIKAGEAWV